MKAPDNDRRVRPVPIEDDNGVMFPDADGPPQPADGHQRRSRMPLAVSVIAIVALVSGIALFGAVEFRDTPAVEPVAFSPTTVPEHDTLSDGNRTATLEEAVPGITDSLTLLTTNSETIWTLVWDPSIRTPRTSVAVANGQMDWTSASFDSGGRLVAALGSSDSEGGGQEVRFGSPSSIDDVAQLHDVQSFQWHAVDVGRLAFVRSVDDMFALEVVEIDFLTHSPKDSNVILVLDELPHIIRWDNDGFIIQLGNQTVALDQRGNWLWDVEGWAHASAPDFIPQVRRTNDGVRWFHIDRVSGESTSFADLGINDNAEATEIVTARNSNIFAAATHRKEATTITVGGLSLIAPITAHLFEDVSPYEFTSDAAFLILRSPDSEDLTFLDWREGTFHTLDVPDQGSVLAINVG